MRIIGGDFRGRRLASVGKGDEAAHLRPTSDRVRESLFNVLANAYGDPVSGAKVLDIFAGTGALGLEALSRGAASATFVESGRKALGLLRENIRLCGVQNETRILSWDARKLPKFSGIPHGLVFLDPPYGKGMGELALSAALESGWIADDALIIWEENALIIPPDSLRLIEQRKHGDTVISILERETKPA